VRSLISTKTQKLFMGIGRAMTPESAIVRQEYLGNRTLSGAAANAIPATEPQVTFTVWANTQALLGRLTASLEITVYPDGAGVAPYTMTEDVTGTLLLTGGSLVVDLSPWRTAKAGLLLTNQHTAAQTVRVATELHGGAVLAPGKQQLDVASVRTVP
jgi:hypothetical protein